MTTLQSLLNAADRAAVSENNFQLIDAVLTALIGNGSNVRVRGGQVQFWDQAAADADATKPWRALGVNNGQTIWSDPIAD